MDREWISRRIYSTDHHDRGWMGRLLLLLCLVDHLSAVFGADLSVSTGKTVTLPCDGPEDGESSEVVVLWTFANRPVCWFRNGTWCEHPRFVNRTQLGSIQQKNFSLVINPVRLYDQGGYKCLINGAEIQINRLFVKGARKRRAAEKLPEGSPVCRPYKDKDKEVPDKNPPGAPSSVWLSVILPVAVVIVGLLVWFRRRRRNQTGTQMRTEPTPTPNGLQTVNYEMVPQAPPPQRLQ